MGVFRRHWLLVLGAASIVVQILHWAGRLLEWAEHTEFIVRHLDEIKTVWSAIFNLPEWANGLLLVTGIALILWDLRRTRRHIAAHSLVTISSTIPISETASAARPNIEVNFESRAPYEEVEISGQGRTLSTVRIGLKAIGQSFSNCRVFVEKIAPIAPIPGNFPIQLAGSDFLIRHDDPEKLFDVASHWDHVDKFRFNMPFPPHVRSNLWYIDDSINRTIELKITARHSDGSEFQKTALFELSTDESRKLHMKRIQ